MHADHLTEVYRSRVGRLTQGAATTLLLLVVLLAGSLAWQRGWTDHHTLAVLELGVAAGFGLTCLSCLLQRTATNVILLWASVFTGLVAAALMSFT